MYFFNKRTNKKWLGLLPDQLFIRPQCNNSIEISVKLVEDSESKRLEQTKFRGETVKLLSLTRLNDIPG